jgi:hypothetical protein
MFKTESLGGTKLQVFSLERLAQRESVHGSLTIEYGIYDFKGVLRVRGKVWPSY